MIIDFLKELGMLGIILMVMFLLLIPFILTIVVGVALANVLGFTGILWWAFVILFYLIVGSILGGTVNR